MESQTIQASFCSKCKAPVQPEFYFCPQCGKSLKPKPISTSLANQIVAYAVSLLLPPLGLYYTYKYFKLHTNSGKIIAWITIILTVLSLIWSLILFKDILDAYRQSMSQLRGW